jgi:Tfp pilus assembly protein PilV
LLLAFTCAGQDLTTGLVAHYTFSGNANDASGNGNNGTVLGPVLTTDRHGNPNQAYSFDGVDDMIKINDSSSLRPNLITMTAWVNPSEMKRMAIFCKNNSSNAANEQYTCALESNLSTSIYIKQNSSCIAGNGWQQTTTTQAVSFNQWSFVAYTFDGFSLSIFINGVLVAQKYNLPLNTIDNCVGGALQIGYWWDSYKEAFKGRLDDLRIYNRALSGLEVKQLYKNEAPTTNITTGLVAHYTFTSNANDASGNSNNGVVLGPTLTTDRHGNPNQAYSFDGVDDMIKVNDAPSLRPNLITMTAWVNPSEAKRMQIFGKTTPLNAANEQYACALENNSTNSFSASVSIKQNSNCSAGNGWQKLLAAQTLSLNQWNFVAYTFDGFSLSIFINGVLIAQKYNLPRTTIDNCVGGTLQIGYWWDSDKAAFKGKLDDLRIYNRALSHNDIAQLYLSEKPITNISNDLVGYYPFDANANDISGYSNHGTPNGAVPTTDRFGNANRAYAFDGNDFITVPNSPILQSIDSSITISGWAISTSKDHAIMCKSGNDLSAHFRLQSIGGGTISFITNNNYVNYAHNFIPNVWYHFAAVSNGKTYKLYLNGSQVYSSASQGSYPLNKTNSLEFGRDLHNIIEYHTGKLDELRIYKRALSDMEVLELHRADNNIISVQSGNWDDPNTWSCDCVPTFTDNVTIKSSHVVEISAEASGKCRIISTETGAILKIPTTANFLANPKL